MYVQKWSSLRTGRKMSLKLVRQYAVKKLCRREQKYMSRKLAVMISFITLLPVGVTMSLSMSP